MRAWIFISGLALLSACGGSHGISPTTVTEVIAAPQTQDLTQLQKVWKDAADHNEFDLRSASQTSVFSGDVSNLGVICGTEFTLSRDLTLTVQSSVVEFVPFPSACNCPVGTDPAFCSKQCGDAQASESQSANAYCASLVDKTYEIKIESSGVEVCPNSIQSPCLDMLPKTT